MRPLIIFTSLALSLNAFAQNPTHLKFDLGDTQAAEGYIAVSASDIYSKDRGYGIEPWVGVESVVRSNKRSVDSDFITGQYGFKFSAAVPEGNYKITVTLGDKDGESLTTIKSEARRLMVESFKTAKGKTATVSFIVNTRTPALSPGNTMKLDSREWNYSSGEAITATWDDKLTLQFIDAKPCVCAIELEKIEDAVTVFVIGDSTVTDQVGETTGTWAQMLPRWFEMPVVIANHAESGQTMKAFRFQRRWDKIMSEIKPGDYVFMQFGHNDSKSSGHDGMWPADDGAGEWAMTHSDANTDYIWGLAINAVEIKRRGGIPVIVSPITRISRQTGTHNVAGHGDYPEACRKAAELAECAFIDLTAMSVDVMNGLGTVITPTAYTDATHTSLYGGYLLSKCVVQGIRDAGLDLARYLKKDAGQFDPKHPTPMPEQFTLPADPRDPNRRRPAAIPYQGPQ